MPFRFLAPCLSTGHRLLPCLAVVSPRRLLYLVSGYPPRVRTHTRGSWAQAGLLLRGTQLLRVLWAPTSPLRLSAPGAVPPSKLSRASYFPILAEFSSQAQQNYAFIPLPLSLPG